MHTSLAFTAHEALQPLLTQYSPWFWGRITPSGPGPGAEDSMRKAESAGIRDLESCLLVRLAMKASWLSLPSCTATVEC